MSEEKEFKKKFKEKMDSTSKELSKGLYPSDKDIEYIKTSTSKDVDDDGYEEGKSKTRELIEEALKKGDSKDFMFKRGMKMLMEK